MVELGKEISILNHNWQLSDQISNEAHFSERSISLTNINQQPPSPQTIQHQHHRDHGGHYLIESAKCTWASREAIPCVTWEKIFKLVCLFIDRTFKLYYLGNLSKQ